MIDIRIAIPLVSKNYIIAQLFFRTDGVLHVPFQESREQTHVSNAQIGTGIGNDQGSIVGHPQIRFRATGDGMIPPIVPGLHVEDSPGHVSATIFPHLPRTTASESSRQIAEGSPSATCEVQPPVHQS